MGHVLAGAGATELENGPSPRTHRDAWLSGWTPLRAQRSSTWLFHGDDLVGDSPYGMVCAWDRHFLAGHFGDGGTAAGLRSGGGSNCIQCTSRVHSADASASSCHHCGLSPSCGLRHNPLLRRGTAGGIYECPERAQETHPRGGKSLSVSVGR